jgi:hypothetical protein
LFRQRHFRRFFFIFLGLFVVAGMVARLGIFSKKKKRIVIKLGFYLI